MAQPRQTRLEIYYKSKSGNKEMTEDIMPDLLSFSYSDKETDEADEISLTLKDEKGKWAGRFQRLKKGKKNQWFVNVDRIEVYIKTGDIKKATKKLYCGIFSVDEISYRGAPRTFEVKAVSIPLDTPIRRKLKNRAFDKATLASVAKKIASENKMKIVFDRGDDESSEAFYNMTFDRAEQKWESDLAFLGRLAKDAGLSLKIKGEKIIIFDQSSYEKKKPLKTLTLGESLITSWEFSSSQGDLYKSCEVRYSNPRGAGEFTEDLEEVGRDNVKFNEDMESENIKSLTCVYLDPELAAAGKGQDYQMKKRAVGRKQAERLAKAKLRELNRRAVTGRIDLVGDVDLIAGIVVECKKFGGIDGNYIITEANHDLSESGYTTSLSLKLCNTNY